MKKTVNINLAGIVFHIEEDAYEKLHAYLENLKTYFQNTEGQEEILTDIEARIAERFQEKLKEENREVVVMNDVEEVIAVMGQPEEFEEAGEEKKEQKREEKKRGRVYRNPDDKILGGVCSGISAYLDIDPLWLRLAFALSFFIWGTGILIYIILWVIIPEAKTPAEKLEMRGERVTVSNIEKTINEELEELKKKFNDFTKGAKSSDKSKSQKKTESRIGNFFTRVIDMVASLFGLLFRFVGKVFALVALIVVVCFAIALGVALFSSLGVMTVGYEALMGMFFTTQWQYMLAIASLLLFLGMPLLAIILKGFQRFFNMRPIGRPIGVSLGILWFIGIILCGIVTVQMLIDFSHKEKFSKQYKYDTMIGDTLYVDAISDSNMERESVDMRFGSVHSSIHVDEDEIWSDQVHLDIRRSKNGTVRLKKTQMARGGSNREAVHRAKHINYQVQQDGDQLTFPADFLINPDQKWRSQQVGLTLYVPVGKIIAFGKHIDLITDDIDYTPASAGMELADHLWRVDPEGLTCLNCPRHQTIQVDDDETSKNYDLKDFDRITINDDFDVEVRKGDTYSVRAKGDKETFEAVEIETRAGKLIADMEDDFFDIFKEHKTIDLYITMPQLREVELNGAVKAQLSGFSPEEITVNLSGASEMECKIKTQRMRLTMSGGSELLLFGKIERLDADLSGASELNAFDCTVTDAIFELSGASEAQVTVTNTLEVEGHGASTLNYKGDPESVKADLTTASEVNEVEE